jgi:ribosomal protein S18 acetylase RimI-like enzyme
MLARFLAEMIEAIITRGKYLCVGKYCISKGLSGVFLDIGVIHGCKLSMYIVKSTESHVEQLVELFEEYRLFCGFEPSPIKTAEFLKKLIGNEEAIMFLAIDPQTNSVMGFVNLYPCYSSLALQRLWILNDLGVSSRFRRRGVSKALIHKVQEFARETDAIRIELKAKANNTTALNLYQSMGFTIDTDNVYYRVPC